jgi:hypothetical protein
MLVYLRLVGDAECYRSRRCVFSMSKPIVSYALHFGSYLTLSVPVRYGFHMQGAVALSKAAGPFSARVIADDGITNYRNGH